MNQHIRKFGIGAVAMLTFPLWAPVVLVGLLFYGVGDVLDALYRAYRNGK